MENGKGLSFLCGLGSVDTRGPILRLSSALRLCVEICLHFQSVMNGQLVDPTVLCFTATVQRAHLFPRES